MELKGSYAHRAEATVIATLLLIAIAVVGGTIIALYTNSTMSSAQVSGRPYIELVQFLGHDTRDVLSLVEASNIILQGYTGGIPDGSKNSGERVAIFVQNLGVNQLVINELRFAGTVYTFTPNVGTLGSFLADVAPSTGEYVILIKAPDVLLDSSTPIIEAGQTATLILSLDNNIKNGRQAQVKITTNQGSAWVTTAPIGVLIIK